MVVIRAQDEKKHTPPDEAEEIITINTDLIQTGVAVFDKNGRFIDNLKREDFELSVDGKPVTISFFQQNALRRGEAAAATAEQNRIETGTPNNAPGRPGGRGRNILFVVDDFHLSFDSHQRVKKTILKFIEQEMLPEDTVAIVSPTGKIGFLQQFTNDKTVLRTAVERLVFNRDRSANDRAAPPMTEYEALLVNQYDSQVTEVFAAQEFGVDPEARRNAVRSRARTILAQAAAVNRGTYSTLEQAMRNAAQLPGRKVVFFISDGFLLNPTDTDADYRMRLITDAAARTNAVIYSVAAKGLEAGFPEGTTAATTAAYRVQAGERAETQDGLSLLASETGGRFIHNTNDLQTGFTKSIEEASQYYLLAWQPVAGSGGAQRLRKIEVRIKQRPELKVRVHGGYLDKQVTAVAAEKSKPQAKQGKNAPAALSMPEQQLDAAASALMPARTLPTALTVSYWAAPDAGMLVAVALQIKGEAVEFTPKTGEQAVANIDLLGLIYDSHGQRAGFFRELLTVDAALSALAKAERKDIYHDYQTKLKPGLYQVRVAARDVKSGSVGSAVQWIDIPDLTTRRLTLSSLLLSERPGDAHPAQAGNDSGAADLRVIVDRRIARTSQLRYIVFIYNAAQGNTGTAQPDVTVQTQILRGDEVALTSPVRPISTAGQEPTRLPYAAEISLATLPAGHYVLLVSVQDRIAHSDSAQQVSFEVK